MLDLNYFSSLIISHFSAHFVEISLLDSQLVTAMAGEPVGDFYVHLLKGQEISKEMTSSQKLLRLSNGNRPSVIHFYDGG